METEVTQTRRKGEFFPPYFELFRRIDAFPIRAQPDHVRVQSSS